jgi:hypothetical protein
MNQPIGKLHEPLIESASNLEAIRFDRPLSAFNPSDEPNVDSPVPASVADRVDPLESYTEEKLALIREVVPRTLRSLFFLRILFCVAATVLGLAKIMLVPPLSKFFLDISQDIASGLEVWMHAADVVVSGLLAMMLALVVCTFLIQARVQAQVDREIAAP